MPNPTCPHCNYEFSSEQTWNGPNDNEVFAVEDNVSDLTCYNCGNNFHVVCEHEVTWHPCDADGKQ